MYTQLAILFSLSVFATARIYSYENADGSYTIGHTSDSTGQPENSVLALLTKAAGYTLDQQDYDAAVAENDEVYSSLTSTSDDNNINVKYESITPGKSLLEPHMELLKLVEAFIRLKGEVGSRLKDVLTDNYDILRSLYTTVLSKVGKLHTFTLIGIQIIRKVLLFAATLFSQWQKPSISVGGEITSMFSF